MSDLHFSPSEIKLNSKINYLPVFTLSTLPPPHILNNRRHFCLFLRGGKSDRFRRMKYLTPSARTETFVQVDTIRPFSSLSFYSHYSSLIRSFSSLSFYFHYSSLIRPFSSLSFYSHYSSLISPFLVSLSPSLWASLIRPFSSLSSYTHPSSVPSPFFTLILILHSSLLLPLLLYSSFIRPFFFLSTCTQYSSFNQIHIRPIDYFSSSFLL